MVPFCGVEKMKTLKEQYRTCDAQLNRVADAKLAILLDGDFGPKDKAMADKLVDDAFKVMGWTPDFTRAQFGGSAAWKLWRAIAIELESIQVIDLNYHRVIN